jgi:hypothetical protein
MLPASAVRRVWDDPRGITYLLVWKGRQDGKIKEAVRVFIHRWPGPGEAPHAEIKRTDGRNVDIYFTWQWKAHERNSLLLRCWSCQKPSRALYGARVGTEGRYYAVRQADWQCRRCAGLRYSSEGGRLVVRSRGNFILRIEAQHGVTHGSLRWPRPPSWHPYIFSEPANAVEPKT